MKFSEDKIIELKNQIRFEMVKNPNVSILELQGILRYNYSHNFDKNFIGKLKRKVHRERAVRYNFASLNEELAKLEDLVRYGRRQLVDVVFNEEGKYKPREIINAFRAIIWSELNLFDAKLNAGIFNRPQSPEKEKPLSPEQKENISRAIDMMYSGICEKCADFHYRESHEKRKNN